MIVPLHFCFLAISLILLPAQAVPTRPRQSYQERSASRRRLLGLEDPIVIPTSSFTQGDIVDWRAMNTEFSRLNINDASRQAEERITSPRDSRHDNADGSPSSIDVIQAEIDAHAAIIRTRMQAMTPSQRRRYTMERRMQSNSIVSELESQRQREEAMERIRNERIESGSNLLLSLALQRQARADRMEVLTTPMGTRESALEDEEDDKVEVFQFDTPR